MEALLLIVVAGALVNTFFEVLFKDVLGPTFSPLAKAARKKVKKAWERLRDIVRAREPSRPIPREMSA